MEKELKAIADQENKATEVVVNKR